MQRRVWLVLLSAVFIVGCVQVRLLTYPAEFTYLDSSSVKSVMHELAWSMAELDSLVANSNEDTVDPATRQAVLGKLNKMEELAVSLSSSTTGIGPDGKSRPVTNHLLIDEHIDDFLEQIVRARLLVEFDPPNYYGAGQLSGNCNACHRLR